MPRASTGFKPAKPGWHRVAITEIKESADLFQNEKGKAKRYEFLLSFSDPNTAGAANMRFWAGATFATRMDKTPSNFSRLLSAADPGHVAHDPITGEWNDQPVPVGDLDTLYSRECEAEVIREPHKDDKKKMVSRFADFRPCSQAVPAKPANKSEETAARLRQKFNPSSAKKTASITGEEREIS